MPKKDIQELEKLLVENFGENLSGDKITHIVIKEVLKKGLIQNEENYRVVYEYLQDISQSDPFYDEIIKLESLLEKYEIK